MFRYVAINIFGLQIVSTRNGDEHRRHKKIVKPCFNESIMQSGWDKVRDAFGVMKLEEGLATSGGGDVRDLKGCMIKLTLYVFGRSGFNIDIPWNIPESQAGEESRLIDLKYAGRDCGLSANLILQSL
uniref:Uncharacterized protein n=1 Tax=Kwoniella dejecticola CBS 10117 TaxID=1296121 RepID=A0A1A6AAY2_9TREE|nr:uncharacterized protein I303_03227 [Kwoniella dejecticola CBS 10117]OBR87203.1 hypothetical protein I303_03227 [Kwoniella dejecticola CBS 10117]